MILTGKIREETEKQLQMGYKSRIFGETEKISGATVNIYSPKKALPNTYLLANKYSPVFFSQYKKTPGSVYLPVNKCCLGKYLLPFSYSVSIIGHNSYRFTPKPSLRQIKSKFSPKWISQQKQNVKISKIF